MKYKEDQETYVLARSPNKNKRDQSYIKCGRDYCSKNEKLGHKATVNNGETIVCVEVLMLCFL